MQDSNQEIIRRVLSNVLTRLERPASVAPSASFVQSIASEGGPVILVVLGNAEQVRENIDRNSAPVFNESHGQLEISKKTMIQTQASSPELERFASLEVKQNGLAPKTCFMEPDRICVNSGACEMRGY